MNGERFEFIASAYNHVEMCANDTRVLEDSVNMKVNLNGKYIEANERKVRAPEMTTTTIINIRSKEICWKIDGEMTEQTKNNIKNTQKSYIVLEQ